MINSKLLRISEIPIKTT